MTAADKRKPITAQDAVEILNRFLAYDPAAVTKVFDNRVLVKPEAEPALTEDPTLIPGTIDVPGRMTVGALGIINGLFGSKIAACYERDFPDHGLIVRFKLDE